MRSPDKLRGIFHGGKLVFTGRPFREKREVREHSISRKLHAMKKARITPFRFAIRIFLAFKRYACMRKLPLTKCAEGEIRAHAHGRVGKAEVEHQIEQQERQPRGRGGRRGTCTDYGSSRKMSSISCTAHVRYACVLWSSLLSKSCFRLGSLELEVDICSTCLVIDISLSSIHLRPLSPLYSP